MAPPELLELPPPLPLSAADAETTSMLNGLVASSFRGFFRGFFLLVIAMFALYFGFAFSALSGLWAHFVSISTWILTIVFGEDESLIELSLSALIFATRLCCHG